jgi:serine/threonine-protein kinase
MASSSKLNQAAGEAERLGHALVSRGLITPDDYQKCRASSPDGSGAQTLLDRLVQSGFLTVRQAERAAEDLPVLVGQQIPGYQLLEQIGQGAMGTVYKARQLSMDRVVAIKVLHAQLAADPKYLERFTREAHLAAKLSSNNVVQAIDVGSAGAIHYFVMEYVEGTTIKRELDRGKVYGEEEAVEIVLQVAQALQQAHRRRLVHRDIKPANVILTPEGIAKLADLGMARETADRALARAEKGMALGTPFYISPEQVRGREDIDTRADIYALGATFYHMVTGRPPFPGPGVDAVMRAHLQEELTPPDHINQTLSAGVGEVVEFMMAKERRERYQTPEDLILDLECLLNGEPPKLARARIEAAARDEGGEDEEQVDEEAIRDARPAGGIPVLWLGVLGGLLLLSVLVNLVLLLRG